jgi:cyclopropane fatty-acyl-phospholipid synthase-like methyltransferase
VKKPVSEACERNKGPILEVLKQYIQPHHRRLLEIGAGTGQHAVYFAPNFPDLQWMATDVPANHNIIAMWLREAAVDNIEGPLRFKVGTDDFPTQPMDAVYTANTFHIMPWKEVKTLIKMFGHRLRKDSLVFIYGPFNYNGSFTSPSNAEFDAWLKKENPESGIRNFEDVNRSMVKQGFELLKDHEMPANNRLLVYRRLPHQKN